MRVGIGILGGGTVGGTLARKLTRDHKAITAKSGIELELVRVAVRDLSKPRPFSSDLLTDDPMSVVDDPDVQLVVEVMGGLEPARSLVLAALEAGKPVVTANKELIAAEGPVLFQAAAAAGVSLLFEAAVGGGIPLIRPLSESLAGEPLTRILGIVNGTTNYILTAMAEEGRAYGDVLAEAQELGYAEADPTADVGGGDAAAKAAILAGLGFGVWVGSDRVYREGIEGIDVTDIAAARQLGYVVKLLAVAEQTEAGACVRVHPAMVPVDHPLAAVRGANNAVFVEGPAVGELLFSGPGAGGEPTATAVLGDVIAAARELLSATQVAPRIRFGDGQVLDFAEATTKWYLRLEVADAPGVLARIAAMFGDHDVSIMSLWQEGRGDDATLLLVTHDAREADLRAAAAGLDALDVVKQVAGAIRVISPEP
ncbi:MAG TPA: homoserine dehydrogenase [Acidimicrobiia bacterium]|nr:homoserine dehydrogenase [Acidimicrobiia bacterium]